MIYDWMVDLEKKGDEDAKYYLAMERYKIELFSQHPDEDDYMENEDRDVKNIQIVYQIINYFLVRPN